MTGFIEQYPFNVVARIKPGHKDALRSLLAASRQDVEDAARKLEIHFLRWVIIDDDPYLQPRESPDILVLNLFHDGPASEFLAEFSPIFAPLLDAFYEHCDGYPEKPDDDARLHWLTRMSGESGTGMHFVAARGRRVRQIEREHLLARFVADVADRLAADADRPRAPKALFEAIRGRVRDSKAFDDLLEPPPLPPAGEAFKRSLFRFVYGAVPPAWALAGVGSMLYTLAAPASLARWAVTAALAAPLIVIRTLEHLEARSWIRTDRVLDEARFQQVRIIENPQGQNQMSAITPVKGSWLRRTLLAAVLKLGRGVNRFAYEEGRLRDVSSIHFAQWWLLDGGRRLLFISNYDGNWESYMDDFIDAIPLEFAGIWSNTLGFPPTRFVAHDGVTKYPREFKAFVRSCQFPTEVWYRAYPHLSVGEVLENSRMREGLCRDLSESEAAEWLRRL